VSAVKYVISTDESGGSILVSAHASTVYARKTLLTFTINTTLTNATLDSSRSAIIDTADSSMHMRMSLTGANSGQELVWLLSQLMP
jgi:hypothetical protein